MDHPALQESTPNSEPNSVSKTYRQIPHSPPHPQLSSPFFSRLPYDCRLLIYHHILSTPFTRLSRYSNTPSLTSSRANPSSPSSPLSLLLSCRHSYLEALSPLYSTTTFIFATPQDLSRFLELSPTAGLKGLKSVILAYGRVDWREGGPIYDYDGHSPSHWSNAFSHLSHLPSLRHLEVWLSHRNNTTPYDARRPREGCVDEGAEKRHGDLFEVLGSVKGVKEYMVRMSWNPVDVLEGREWPFDVELMSADEMGRRKVEEGWPRGVGVELCD